MLTRRQFGQYSAALLAATLAGLPKSAFAGNPTGKKLHGLSAFGDLKYGPDYQHFAYVNPDAPKGGTFNFSVADWLYNQNPQSFDTLNTLVLKGNAPPKMEHCFDALMTLSSVPKYGPVDEPSAAYCMLAESVELSDDRNTYTFLLRPEARFHDGSPVTATDIAFTYNTLKEFGHPDMALNLINLIEAVAVSERVVELRFNGKQSEQVAIGLAGLPIISKRFYSENDFASSTMIIPLSSGPYKVGKFKAGNFVEYHRVEDYWAKDMPFARGLYNFDVLRIEFYRERQAAFEAFKKGEIYYREEFTSKTWATEYEFPAVTEGKVIQKLFPSDSRPLIQGFVTNLRRSKLADKRTRMAIGHCFDFEWTNENLFYGAYARNQSYFESSDFRATGAPSAEEVMLLEPLRDKLDPSVFESALEQPVSNGSGKDRSLLRKANKLLQDAGWKRQGRTLVDADGAPFTLEFLMRSPSFERILAPFLENLKRIGIQASIRLVDPSQYQKRLEDFDFDIIMHALGMPPTPSQEGMEQIFGSQSASVPGSPNVAGLKDPAVDGLIRQMGTVSNREELKTVLKALDRVLRSTHSWIPNWNSANHRVAYWDMFGRPPAKPDYGFPIERMWWFDEAKAKAIGKA